MSLLRNGKKWLYVEPNVESIKSQLQYLVKNGEFCKELWKKARIRVINNYDKNITIWRNIRLCKKYL